MFNRYVPLAVGDVMLMDFSCFAAAAYRTLASVDPFLCGFPATRSGSPGPGAPGRGPCPPQSRMELTCKWHNPPWLRWRETLVLMLKTPDLNFNFQHTNSSSPSVRETWSHMPSSWPKHTTPPSLSMPSSAILQEINNYYITATAVNLVTWWTRVGKQTCTVIKMD